MKKLLALWGDESGASAAEYALILAIVGAGIALASVYLGTTIKDAISETADCIAETANCPDAEE